MKWINSRGTVNRSARKDLSRRIVERTGEKVIFHYKMNVGLKKKRKEYEI